MSDAASGVAGKTSARELHERFSEQRGGRVVGGRKELAIQQVARRECCWRETGTSDSASGAAGKTSKRERNERFSERRSGQGVC
jgi:hypothetical protein